MQEHGRRHFDRGSLVQGILENSLARHLTVALLVKFALLYLIWFSFFRLPDSQAPLVDQVEAALFGTPSSLVDNARPGTTTP
jgi:hypothetical protein